MSGPQELTDQKPRNKAKSLPKAWGSGPIRLNGVEIECAILMDGTAILHKGRMMKALGRSWRGKSRSDSPTFIGAKNLQQFIKPELKALFEGIEYTDGQRTVTGYEAKILPLICQAYRDAQRAGALTANQLPTAQACEILSDAFAITGLTALIYEQLGYEKFKHPEAFRMLVESYMSEEVRKWSKEFPDELFFQMDRIYGNQPTTSRNRPLYYAGFLRKYIYDPIQKGEVLKELDKKNPKVKGIARKGRHHSNLSENVGLPAIRSQIWQVVAALKMSANKQKYETNFNRIMGQTYQTDMFED